MGDILRRTRVRAFRRFASAYGANIVIFGALVACLVQTARLSAKYDTLLARQSAIQPVTITVFVESPKQIKPTIQALLPAMPGAPALDFARAK